MYRLSEDDGRAVDLFLETRAVGSAIPAADQENAGRPLAEASVGVMPIANLSERLGCVERLFDAMEEWTAPEPPAALVSRTIRTIEAREQAAVSPLVAAVRTPVGELPPPA